MPCESLFSLEGKVVAITGGMGQLGRRFHNALISRGARVAILDVAAPDLARSNNSTDGRASSDTIYLTSDVTDKGSLVNALACIRDVWSEAPTGLINCAALDSPPDSPEGETGPFEEFPQESWDRVIDVNVKGTFLSSQVFGAEMAQSGGGSIVNVGSIYGLVSPDHRIYNLNKKASDKLFFKPVAYSASKSALLNLTKYIAVYWAEAGVRANLLVPGGLLSNQNKDFISNYSKNTPMNRMANPGEFDGAIIFLLSNASSYMTGASIVVDGGWTAW